MKSLLLAFLLVSSAAFANGNNCQLKVDLLTPQKAHFLAPNSITVINHDVLFALALKGYQVEEVDDDSAELDLSASNFKGAFTLGGERCVAYLASKRKTRFSNNSSKELYAAKTSYNGRPISNTCLIAFEKAVQKLPECK